MLKHTVLFVDDEPNILKALERLLRNEDLRTLCASRPSEALNLLKNEQVHVVVSDMRMPEQSGEELLGNIRESHPEIIRIMLTGHSDIQIAMEAINQGEIYRLINKPWDDEDLKSVIHSAVHEYAREEEIKELHRVTHQQNETLVELNQTLELQVRQRTKQLAEKNLELRNGYIETIRALAEAVDAKDAYTRGHSERVGIYASKIAQEMSFPKEFIERVYIAGVLHDIGKIGVPDAIIAKPGKLTKEEYARMSEHPEIGARILEPVSFLADVVPCVRHHHEWYDGSDKGYPLQLKGEAIPLPSRILLVADTVEAMTSDRPYRKALPIDCVVSELNKYSGQQFDPDCVRAFMRLLEVHGEDFFLKGSNFDIYEFLEA
ncbi:MAG: response regulator [Deltaproteobacteria bacterium]|nr:response regulator [Deltaproteobacteria bacterium]